MLDGFFAGLMGRGILAGSLGRGKGEGKACVNKIRSDSVILRENSMLLLKNIRCFG